MENINVKALVRLVGINENTLRGWERRYKAVTPSRGEDGHRLYSSKDVQRIKLLYALVKEGHTIGKIAHLPNTVLKKMLTSTLSPDGTEIKASEAKTEKYLEEMIEALQKFNLEKLNQTLQKAKFELSSKEIILNLIRPLLVRVGALISEKRFSITQEHLLSSLIRDYLGTLYQLLSPYDYSSRAKARNIILTTREGDFHEFGILLASLLCNLYRYKTYYLGPNMPAVDLIEACGQFKADFLILGLMSLPHKTELIKAQDFVSELDNKLPRRVSICLGGSEKVDVDKLKSERQFIVLNDLIELDRFLSKNA